MEVITLLDKDFTVTLLENPKVEGTAFPRSGKGGLAKSIAAVPDGWVRLASTHITIARILTPSNDDLWKQFDVNTELARVKATKNYDFVRKGESPYILIVNGQTFSRDPDAMFKYVQGKGELDGDKNVGLVANSFPLSTGYADKVLGDKVVWAVNDGEIQEIQVPVFTLDQYRKAQQDSNFLLQYPVFIGVLTQEQAEEYYMHNSFPKLRNEDGVFSPNLKLTAHVPSHMQAGTEDAWDRLLKVAAEDRGYDSFFVGLRKLAENSGLVGNVSVDFSFFFNSADEEGCSIGVKSPEALDALVNRFVELQKPSRSLSSDAANVVKALRSGAGLLQTEEAIYKAIKGKYTIQHK